MLKKTVIILFLSFPQWVSATQTTYEKDTPITLSDNSHVTIPGGWSFDSTTQKLISPEGDLSVYLVQKPFIGKPEQIALTAWQAVNKDFNFKLSQNDSPVPEDDWDYDVQLDYEIPVKENRMVFSRLRVFKGAAYLILLDGTKAGFDKRIGQFILVFDTWRPDGFKKEDISQHKVKIFSSDDALEMDRFLARSTAALDVPGAAVAIVQDGKIVYRKAVGVKAIGKKDPVTLDTLFMIGSMTKPLTTLMLSKQVEQGKLTWDTPINQALPAFALADKDITQKFLIKHAACACTGMPRRDFEIVFGSKIKTVDDRLQQLHTMLPTTGFGETFQYSNGLVAVGGLAGANVYDKGTDLFNKYENAMTDLVFTPLDMSSTRVKPYTSDADRLASPHARGFNGKMAPFPQTIDDMVYADAPAGSIWSTVDDIAKYLIMELNKGKDAQGNVLFSAEQIEKRRTPGVNIGDNASYGLGLVIENTKGITIVSHGGAVMGFTSDMLFLPEHNIGMVVLRNGRMLGFGGAMRQKFLEILLAAKPKSDRLLETSVKYNKDILAKLHARVSIKPKDTHWLADYVGHYENTDLGPVTVKKSAKGYQLITPRWASELGSATEQSGDKLLFPVSAPWSSSDEFVLRVQKQPKQLILNDVQVKYVFDAVR